MKKKLWIIAVVAMLVVAVLASLAACGNLFSKNDEPVEPEDELTAEEPEVEATEEPEETAQPEEPEATKTPASTGKGTGEFSQSVRDEAGPWDDPQDSLAESHGWVHGDAAEDEEAGGNPE